MLKWKPSGPSGINISCCIKYRVSATENYAWSTIGNRHTSHLSNLDLRMHN